MNKGRNLNESESIEGMTGNWTMDSLTNPQVGFGVDLTSLGGEWRQIAIDWQPEEMFEVALKAASPLKS